MWGGGGGGGGGPGGRPRVRRGGQLVHEAIMPPPGRPTSIQGPASKAECGDARPTRFWLLPCSKSMLARTAKGVGVSWVLARPELWLLMRSGWGLGVGPAERAAWARARVVVDVKEERALRGVLKS